MGRHFLWLGLLFLLMDAFASASIIHLGRTESATIVVPDDFLTIQEAINNAVGGDTIFVKTGTYYEHVVVNKTVSLVGEDSSATIIDGNKIGRVIDIISNNVNVTGFTVQNSGSIANPNLDAGICLNSITNCTISENSLVGNGFAGISLLNSQRNTIASNNVTGTGWGGIHLMGSSDNTVSANILDSNVYVGINGHASSHRNNIKENVISNSTYGMFYHNANYNKIFRNSISDIAVESIWLQDLVSYNIVAENNLINNTVAIRLQGPNNYNILERNVITGANYGMKIQNYARYTLITENTIDENYYGIWIDGGSTANTFYYNNFLNNTQHINVVGISVNNWDNGYPSGGNYWSDYNGSDLDHNGIGDANYSINANNVDMYPLMGTFSSFDTSVEKKVNIISNSIVNSYHYEPSNTIRFYVSNKTMNQTQGFCRVTIPYEILSEPFNVTIDGANPIYWNYTLFDNGTHRWIYFEYAHSTKEVVIVPDFSSFLFPSLFMILTLIVVIVSRKKKISK